MILPNLGDMTEFLGFDLETTGVDTETDRIVTASTVYRQVGKSDEEGTNMCLFNPGVTIPSGATSIHGITTKMAVQHGADPEEELPFFHNLIKGAWSRGVPLVGCNITFDLSMFAAELRRYDLPEFEVKGPILDIMVLHRMAGYKKATLALMTEHYGVKNTTAHDSTSDVIATLDVLQTMIAQSAYLQQSNLRDLYMQQQVSHRIWARNMQQFFNRIGKKDQVNDEWPLKGVS